MEELGRGLSVSLTHYPRPTLESSSRGRVPEVGRLGGATLVFLPSCVGDSKILIGMTPLPHRGGRKLNDMRIAFITCSRGRSRSPHLNPRSVSEGGKDGDYLSALLCSPRLQWLRADSDKQLCPGK